MALAWSARAAGGLLSRLGFGLEGGGRRVALVLLALGLGMPVAGAQESAVTGELVDRSAFRVCADPEYLPFSNQAGEGFENKIALLMANELDRPLIYTWYPRSAGFVRNTIRAHRCDVVMGTVTGDELLQNTNPYYRSTYVLAVRAADASRFPDLDAPAVRAARIGVVAATPPSDLLERKGLLANVQPYGLIVDPRYDNPGQQMMAALGRGEIDIGLIWGPLAGYWAARQPVEIKLTPLTGDRRQGVQMDYRVSLGIRPGEPDWKHELEQLLRRLEPEINAILAEYHVPLLDRRGQLIDPATLAAPRAEEPARPRVVPEPAGYRMESYRAPVPETLAGATVLDGPALQRLIAEARPILIDVLPRQPRPANRAPDALWIEPQRADIEGSVWLPNVGYGYLPTDTLRYFRESLAALTEGDRSRPLVFYCDPDCWMSWNAAKRALTELGYTNVFWYPAGAAGWEKLGHELVAATIFRPEEAGLGQ